MLDETHLNPKELRNAFGSFATGVTVISMLDVNGRPTGVTVGSFTSLSLSPALCLFSLDKNQVSCRWIREGEGFNVNVLSEDQQDLAWQFAKPLKDKFEGVAWREGENGLPVIDGSLSHFECRKWNIHDGGDHVIVIGKITHFEQAIGAPLVFFQGQMGTVV